MEGERRKLLKSRRNDQQVNPTVGKLFGQQVTPIFSKFGLVVSSNVTKAFGRYFMYEISGRLTVKTAHT